MLIRVWQLKELSAYIYAESAEIRAYTFVLAFWGPSADSDTEEQELIQSKIHFLHASTFKTRRRDLFKTECFHDSTKCSSPIPCVMQIGSWIQ